MSSHMGSALQKPVLNLTGTICAILHGPRTLGYCNITRAIKANPGIAVSTCIFPPVTPCIHPASAETETWSDGYTGTNQPPTHAFQSCNMMESWEAAKSIFPVLLEVKNGPRRSHHIAEPARQVSRGVSDLLISVYIYRLIAVHVFLYGNVRQFSNSPFRGGKGAS